MAWAEGYTEAVTAQWEVGRPGGDPTAIGEAWWFAPRLEATVNVTLAISGQGSGCRLYTRSPRFLPSRPRGASIQCPLEPVPRSQVYFPTCFSKENGPTSNCPLLPCNAQPVRTKFPTGLDSRAPEGDLGLNPQPRSQGTRLCPLLTLCFSAFPRKLHPLSDQIVVCYLKSLKFLF